MSAKNHNCQPLSHQFVLMKCHIVSQNKYTHRCLDCINNNNSDDADLNTFVLTTQLVKSNKYAKTSEASNYTSDFRTRGESKR